MYFMKFSIAVILLTVCFSGSGFGESRDFQYRIKVRIEPVLHRLEAEIWIKNPPASRFYLQPKFAIRQVDADGKAAAFHQDTSPDSSMFRYAGLRYGVDAGDIRELHMKYGGEIPEAINEVNMISPNLVELALYSAWYPLYDGMRDYTFELEIDLPDGLLLTTNGIMQKKWRQGDRSLSL